MSRSLSVSTEVFAAIWARRKDGEETEDAILRRILGCETKVSKLGDSTPRSEIGVADIRNGVNFPEGFRIFRTYKRREYAAIAQNGAWLRADNGKRYASLNQLNASIAVGAENVWNGNWKYRSADGLIRSIGELRK